MASKNIKAWDFFNDAQKQEMKAEISQFFKEEHDLDLGIIAADAILDFILQTIGTKAYNQGIQDAKLLIKEKLQNIEYDMDVLLKSS